MMKKKAPMKVEYQTLVVLWLALLGSQVVFLLMVYMLEPRLFSIDLSTPFLSDQPLIILVFAIFAIVLLVLSFVFRRQHMARAAIDGDTGCVQTGLVLGCVLSEGVSLLGLLLALVFAYPYFYVWFAAGILGILLHFPRKGSLDAATWRKI